MEAAYERSYASLVEWMERNPLEVLREREATQRRLVKKRFAYGDGVMQSTLVPVFLKRQSLAKLRYTAEVLDALLERLIGLYFTEPRVRDHFPDQIDLPWSWVTQPTHCHRATLISRHDVLFDGQNLQYVEFNTDNPGGKGWTDLLVETFRQQPMYRDLIDLSEDLDRPILAGLYDTLLKTWEAWGRGAGPRPRLAIVGVGACHRGDAEIVRDYFIERGVEANLLDARFLEHRPGRGLGSGGVTFDLVLRSIKANFFLLHPREMKDYHAAVKAGDVVQANPWRGLLGAEKALMSFITNPQNFDLFTAEEVEVVKAHVPWTRTFADVRTPGPEGEEVDLESFLLANRERLVIKPSAGAGGHGVAVGPSTAADAWETLVKEHFGEPGWVVQSYVKIPVLDLPVISGGEVKVEKRFLNLSPYVFGGRYVGCLGRVSSQDVINISAGGGLIPVFALREDASPLPSQPA